MPITAAIFDCDGTLVDSMPMWSGVADAILAAHGIGEKDPELYAAIEPVSLEDGCAIIHERKHVGESPAAIYEEMCAYVRDKYEHETQIFPGCRAFLDELRAAGIPMAVASSTPVREVRVALAAQGIEGYFDHVVSTEDVGGRDKEFPDVYEETLRRLGADRETTWVFEDAPFGVRTAHRAGFPVVALVNDHDGRDEDAISANADILVHGYPELSLALIRDYAVAPAVTSGFMTALVVDGSPEAAPAEIVARLADEADYVIAADRGAVACREAGVTPDVYCGDSDSVPADVDAWARGVASTKIDFPAEKYATDLALAIACARHEAARRGRDLRLVVTSASGGRADHALGVVGLLANAADAAPRLVERDHELRILAPEGEPVWEFGPEDVGRTLTVIAVAPATCVSEEGMRWCLDHQAMGLLDDRGVSNVVAAAGARVTCHAGAVACFLV